MLARSSARDASHRSAFIERQCEVKRRSIPQLRLHPDSPAVPFDDLLADREAHPRPRVLLCRMQLLEDREDLIGVLHVYADAVISDGEEPLVAPRIALHTNPHCWRLLTSELNRVSNQVLEELDELCLITHYHRQRLFWQCNRRPALLDGGLEVVDGVLDDSLAVHRFECLTAARNAGVRKQVLDQLLHVLCPVDGVTHERVCFGTELPLVPALEESYCTRHRPERFLQVMGGNIGKLLEFRVRALQFLSEFLEFFSTCSEFPLSHLVLFNLHL